MGMLELTLSECHTERWDRLVQDPVQDKFKKNKNPHYD